MITRQLLRKLRKMSADEIRVRLTDAVRRRYERRVCRRLDGAPFSPSFSSADALRLPNNAVELVCGSQRQQVSQLKRTWPERFAILSDRAAARAQAILSGPTLLLSHPVDLRAGIDWHRDPRSQYHWPLEFYADLSLEGAGPDVDVKYVWELGRQQYLVALAQGWLFTGDDRYARRAHELMLDWIDCNPVYRGIHWTSALEAAMRSISWIWTLAALSDWPGWTTLELERIAASLYDHGNYLDCHFSFYSSPYNHLIGEAAALYWISLVLPPSPRVLQWRARSRQVLTVHGPRQFYDDGFCVEQAVGYHYYTLGFLSLAVLAARQQKQPLPKVESAVQQAWRAGLAFRRPDGRWPAVGDADSARALPILHDDYWNFDSLCALGAALFGDSQLKISDVPPQHSADPGEELYWLLGCDGVSAWEKLETRTAASCTVLKDAGYAAAAGQGDWLLFDAGPMGAGLHADATPSTAHGHADALQVLFTYKGKPVLIDPGTVQYFGDEQWIASFRNPESHNTIEIEGAAPARFAGRLNWSHVRPRPELNVNLSDEVRLMRGRACWAPGLIVERYVLHLPGEGLWIADLVVSDRPRTVRWYWQLPAGTLNTVSRKSAFLSTHPEAGRAQSIHSSANGNSFGRTLHGCEFLGDFVSLAMWTDGPSFEAKLQSACENSPAGWIAPGYGVLHPGQRATCRTTADSELLTAACIGETVRPFEVWVRGRTLLCGGDEGCHDWEPIDSANSHGADVVWRVQTSRGCATYAAGLDTVSTDSASAEPAGEMLCGIGDWPAAVYQATDFVT